MGECCVSSGVPLPRKSVPPWCPCPWHREFSANHSRHPSTHSRILLLQGHECNSPVSAGLLSLESCNETSILFPRGCLRIHAPTQVSIQRCRRKTRYDRNDIFLAGIIIR